MFSGKATVKAVDRATGASYDVGAALGGNVSFQIDVTDGGEPGSTVPGVTTIGPDTVAVRVWTTNGSILNLDSQADAVYNPAQQVGINGGNIAVPP